MATGRVPTTANSPLTAKGDLFTYDTSQARLAVGSNGDTLVADSSASTGLRWQSAFNGNAVINGGFDIWQRGTSSTFAGTLTYPSADRWFGIVTGSASTNTMSRQTADTTNLQYGMRFGRNSGQTATGDVYVGYAFESAESKRFAGQTITLSFYVKAGANAPLTLGSQIRTGTGTDQSAATLFSTGWTGGANNSQSNTVTTTMTRYSQTVTLGSTVNQIMILFTYTPTGTAGANEWFQIEGVQLEFGSVPTSFKRAGATLAGELAACQRYYYRATSTALYGTVCGTGSGASATTAYVINRQPVTMRTSPSSVEYANLATNDGGGAVAVTAVAISRANPDLTELTITTASGLTQYRPYWIVGNNNTAGYLGFNAEL